MNNSEETSNITHSYVAYLKSETRSAREISRLHSELIVKIQDIVAEAFPGKGLEEYTRLDQGVKQMLTALKQSEIVIESLNSEVAEFRKDCSRLKQEKDKAISMLKLLKIWGQ